MSLLASYGEDERQTKVEEFFGMISRFCTAYTDARKELDAIHAKEKANAKRAEEQAKVRKRTTTMAARPVKMG